MKVQVKDMREPLTVQIQGDEPWLSEIYASFLGNEGRGLTGELTIAPAPYGVYTVKGSVTYTPLVPCSRCDKALAWPIEREVDVRFIDRAQANAMVEFGDDEEDEDIDAEGEALESDDEDTYYLQKEGIDLEMILNDFVQTAMPTRLIKVAPDGKSCAVCLEDLSKPLIFKDKNDEDFSPFAVLKNLKLDDK